ncbi:exosortase-associated EpsI family protein, partial [Pseudomonadota bacterium]
TNKYQTKLVQAKARLLGGRNDGAVIAISAIQLDDREASIELLREFTVNVLPSIRATLDGLGNRP